MKIPTALLAFSGLILASAAVAQTAGTPILAPTAEWDIFSGGGHQPIADTKVEGGKAVEAVTTGTGGIWEVSGMRPIDGGIAKGDHIVASVWIKSNVPAKVVFRVEARAGARDRVYDRFIDVGTAWSQLTLVLVAENTYPAGTTQIALLLNSGKQIIDLGPVSVVNKGGK